MTQKGQKFCKLNATPYMYNNYFPDPNVNLFQDTILILNFFFPIFIYLNYFQVLINGTQCYYEIAAVRSTFHYSL